MKFITNNIFMMIASFNWFSVQLVRQPLVAHAQITFLDKFRPAYRIFRDNMFKFIGPSNDQWSYKWNLQQEKVQKPFPNDQEFFCDPQGPGGRSEIVPTSVHRVRPGDIDIVGALGDSLTAGNGAFATNILQIMIENKGVSWSIGGQGTWHKFLTIPNILKVFNPNIYGYSLTDGYSIQKQSRFNTAEIGAMSRDIPNEAKMLVRRMKGDAKVNIDQHWKLITILVGANDFCLDLCYMRNAEKSIGYFERDLIETLRTLRDSLPRTIINLVTPPSMKIITELRGKSMECETIHHAECPCMFSFKERSNRKYYFNIMERWKDVAEKVANLEEFNNREDFTVNYQPFLKNVVFPTLQNGKNDFTYMSLDCFHLSQKGYALASNALWNNMLESEGDKSTNWKKEFTEIKCPTVQRPYIATKQNSFNNFV